MKSSVAEPAAGSLTGQSAIEFTILMPCLNEAHALAFCIEEARDCIRRLGLEAEILIADNGSTDGSPRIAEQMGAEVVSTSSFLSVAAEDLFHSVSMRQVVVPTALRLSDNVRSSTTRAGNKGNRCARDLRLR